MAGLYPHPASVRVVEVEVGGSADFESAWPWPAEKRTPRAWMLKGGNVQAAIPQRPAFDHPTRPLSWGVTSGARTRVEFRRKLDSTFAPTGHGCGCEHLGASTRSISRGEQAAVCIDGCLFLGVLVYGVKQREQE